MAANNLFTPPVAKYLPVSKGADLAFTVTYKPDGSIANWPSGCTVIFECDTKDETLRKQFTPGSSSVCSIRVESEDCDTWKDKYLWRILLSLPDNPSHEIPVVNGEIKRYDGKMTR